MLMYASWVKPGTVPVLRIGPMSPLLANWVLIQIAWIGCSFALTMPTG